MAAVLAVLLLAAAVGAQTPTGSGGVNHPRWSEAPYVVLVSFDGLRHDYPDRGLTPNLLRLAERGVRADGLIPMFPSKTFANHYSIATGLAPGRHGIVGNDFYDPGFDATYRLRDRMAVEDGRWYGGEPIWVTAETQGMVTAAMFFVGTEAPVRGVQPTWWHKFDESVTEETRIRRVLDWLALPAERRPHLITLYFERLDSHGHRFGPESAELNASLAVADSLLGRLLEGIAALPHGDRVHVLVVTDHGMSPYVREPVILEDWADLAGVRVIAAGPIAHLYTQGDTARARALRAALAAAPGISAYLPEETPPEWQTARNPRFGDVLVVAEEGVQIRQRHQMGERSPASHGWPATRSMHGAFVAAGPRLRSGLRIPAFENVHIYPLLAEILGLEPARAVDGRLDVLRPILKEAAAPAPR
jgi:hypothetical protein